MKSVGEVDGDRAHLQGGVPEGAAAAWRPTGSAGWRAPRPVDDRLDDADIETRAGGAPHARRRSGSSRSSARSTGGVPVAEIARAHRHRPLVPRPDARSWSRRSAAWSARSGGRDDAPSGRSARMKRMGFSDGQLGAAPRRSPEAEMRARRHALGIRPVVQDGRHLRRRVPLDARPTSTPRYDEENEAARRRATRRSIILGSGPNRIGQGVEFDYCCVRAVLAFRELGYRTVMVNSNPETVSTDFDISDALYFEPLTLEDVLEIVHVEQPLGVVVQLGGQTPLKLARGLEAAGVPILGTSPDAIDVAEDRGRFEALARELGVRAAAEPGRRRSVDEAVAVAERIGYPVLVRPSYVLGGRAHADRLRRRRRCSATSSARPGWRRSTRC